MQELIVNYLKIIADEASFMGALCEFQVLMGSYFPFCSAVIITQFIFVTAAHCFYNASSGTYLELKDLRQLSKSLITSLNFLFKIFADFLLEKQTDFILREQKGKKSKVLYPILAIHMHPCLICRKLLSMILQWALWKSAYYLVTLSSRWCCPQWIT